MRRVGTAYGAGLLFGIGLALSGMIDPQNIIAFLDVTGRFSPNLAAVMAGAVGVHFVLLRWMRPAASLGEPGALVDPSGARSDRGRGRGHGIDRRLVIGSAIFGVGWGLAGYCPGPAIVALGFGAGRVWGFVAALALGAWLADALTIAGARQAAPATPRGLSIAADR